MIENMVKSVIEKKISTEYPHLLIPAIVKAKITSALQFGSIYKYNLKIFDKNDDIDERFPEIPDVKSSLQLISGSTVVIAFLYGELDPYIIGEVI